MWAVAVAMTAGGPVRGADADPPSVAADSENRANENAPRPAASGLRIGFGQVDITPQLRDDRPVWIAGYAHGRRATGVHDPLFARAVVLETRGRRLALVGVDLIGLQLPVVQEIRRRLPHFAYVMVSSSHNHEGPDVIGIWGRSPLTSGVDPQYLERVIASVVQAVQQATAGLQPATAAYGTAEDDALLGDSRLPVVKDGVLRMLRFHSPGDDRLLGLLVQWNCHPEALGPRNTLITADFPAFTVAALQKKYEVPVAYFSGAVGGLMAPPDEGVVDSDGRPLREGQFEYAQAYGEAVARLAEQAIDQARPIRLTPWRISPREVAIPLHNPIYKLARSLGVIQRDGVEWKGDPYDLSEPTAAVREGQQYAVTTEVAYLQLGELHVACIPGEIYPELIYGKYQEPAEPGVDFPEAPLEPHLTGMLPGDKMLWFGLANDEIGYLIPRRQWDERPPYAYGRKKAQYGEINSVGPDAAPIIMQALQRCIQGVR